MKSLQRLDLANTQVTDKCIDDLIAMPALRQVFLRGTKVSAAGVERLKKARPKLEISH